MIENEKFRSLIRNAFPAEPRPDRFFSTEGRRLFDRDIPHELSDRISGRLWTDVKLMDWRMIGASPVVVRHYLEPTTFMYYVPSILLGVVHQIEFIDFALEGIIPDNRHHVPRGEWWAEFSGAASPGRREAFSAFLSRIRLESWDAIGLDGQYLLERAENIWSG